MNPLLSKFDEYKSILKYKFVYEFDNGASLEYRLRQTEFPHLLGLHKLTDIPIIQQFRDPSQPNISARYVLSKIKKEELLTVAYTDVIIDFNPILVGSSLNAKYILYEKKNAGGYNHLCIGYGNTGSYAESFFYQPTDRYIVGQNTFSVTKFTIYDENGNIYFTDSF